MAEPPPSPVRCPLPSGLNRSPLSPLRAPSPPGISQSLFSSLCPLPEHCPLSPASRSLLQGTCCLLAGPGGDSMVPAVCCVPLSVRTSSPETLTSPASLCELCCPSRSVLCVGLPPWAGAFPWITWPGGVVSAQAPPSASPLLLPSLVAPSPFPLCLYFCSLNSAESSAF